MRHSAATIIIPKNLKVRAQVHHEDGGEDKKELALQQFRDCHEDDASDPKPDEDKTICYPTKYPVMMFIILIRGMSAAVFDSPTTTS